MKELDSAGILDRCREPGGGFEPVRYNGLSGLLRSGCHISERHLFEWLDEFEAIPENDPRLCKFTPKIKAAVFQDLFFKKYNPRGIFYALRHAMMLSRPERVLAASLRLREFEIPTPEVIAILRRFRWGFPRADYLVTRALSPSLHNCNSLAADFSQGDPYRQFLAGTTALLVKMHSAGVEHGDLNLRNLFCRKSPQQFYSDWGVLDLDGSEIYPEEMPLSRRRRELARLISSYLRAVRHAVPNLPVDENQTIWDFTRKYQELSGLNLSGEALDRRVRMLASRVRKDKQNNV